MSQRLNVMRMFPDGKRTTEAMRRFASQFMKCPNGHALPRRFIHGRCTPVSCADQKRKSNSIPDDSNLKPYQADIDVRPIGFEADAIQAHVGTAEEVEELTAQNEEALALMRAIGRNKAREALFPGVKVPKRVELKDGDEMSYVEQRLKQLLPKALHVKEFLLDFGSRADQNEIADEILDRTGFTRKPEKNTGPVAPINIVIQGGMPWDKGVVPMQVTSQPSPTLPPGLPE